jgi:hypothetical protein
VQNQSLTLARQVIHHVSHSASPFFSVQYFLHRVPSEQHPGCTLNVIFLIFASWVGGIRGMNHWHQQLVLFFWFYWGLNWESHRCYVGALQLEPYLHRWAFSFLLFYVRMVYFDPILFYFLTELGFEHRVSCLPSRQSRTWPISPAVTLFFICHNRKIQFACLCISLF